MNDADVPSRRRTFTGAAAIIISAAAIPAARNAWLLLLLLLTMNVVGTRQSRIGSKSCTVLEDMEDGSVRRRQPQHEHVCVRCEM